jgi:hypothetical protein
VRTYIAIAIYLACPLAQAGGSLALSLTVPPIQTLELLPNNRVHIVSNTGEKLETSFDWQGSPYRLVGCDLSAGHYIDTICKLVKVRAPASGGSQ